MSDIKLPPLPECEATIRDFGDAYASSQMQDYARQCVLADRAARAETVSVDSELRRAVKEMAHRILDNDWAEHISTDEDATTLECAVTGLMHNQPSTDESHIFAIKALIAAGFVSQTTVSKAYEIYRLTHVAAPTQERGADDDGG